MGQYMKMERCCLVILKDFGLDIKQKEMMLDSEWFLPVPAHMISEYLILGFTADN